MGQSGEKLTMSVASALLVSRRPVSLSDIIWSIYSSKSMAHNTSKMITGFSFSWQLVYSGHWSCPYGVHPNYGLRPAHSCLCVELVCSAYRSTARTNMRTKSVTSTTCPMSKLLTDAPMTNENETEHIIVRNKSRKKMKNLTTFACNPVTTMSRLMKPGLQ